MLAAASAVVYLAGTPLGTLLVLFRNSRRLHAPEIESRFGDLYCQYEDRRPYWVVVLMLHKAVAVTMLGKPVKVVIMAS